MEYNLNIKKSNHTKVVLNVVNCFLKLTSKEIDIIATLVDNNIIDINRATKDVIRKSVGIDGYGLNNYILKLRKKGILVNNRLSTNIIQACKDKSIVINLNSTEDAN